MDRSLMFLPGVQTLAQVSLVVVCLDNFSGLSLVSQPPLVVNLKFEQWADVDRSLPCTELYDYRHM